MRFSLRVIADDTLESTYEFSPMRFSKQIYFSSTARIRCKKTFFRFILAKKSVNAHYLAQNLKCSLLESVFLRSDMRWYYDWLCYKRKHRTSSIYVAYTSCEGHLRVNAGFIFTIENSCLFFFKSVKAKEII